MSDYKDRQPKLSYQDEWTKPTLQRLIRDRGQPVPGRTLLQTLKFSQCFRDGKRRSQKFHPTSKMAPTHDKLMSSQKKNKPIVSSIFEAMSKENFGHNQSKCQCFQVQPVTCCDLPPFLYQFEVDSVDTSKMMDNFLKS